MASRLSTLLLLLATAAAQAETSAQQALDAALAPMITAHEGEVTVAVKHLSTGETYLYESEKPMSSASLIKLPIMIAAYKAATSGGVSLGDELRLEEGDKVPGSGLLTEHFSAGTELTLRDAIRLMMGWSDNTATNLVIDKLGFFSTPGGAAPGLRGIAIVNEHMDVLGYKNLLLNSMVFRSDMTVAPERSREFGLGVMNSAETIALLERLVSGDPIGGVSRPQLDSLRREMLGHLRACQAEPRFGRHLPEEVTIAHKTGSVSDARCDAGIIESPTGPIVFCVMTDKNVDHSWDSDASSELLIAEIGKACYAYFTQGQGAVDAPRVARVLRMGRDDPLVVPLQRTLNHVLKPPPDLGVDGDFGPNTQKAVKRFQEQAGIEVTGVVDAATWKAIGPLAMEADPVPPPARALDDLPPLKPQDPVGGPPVTSCPAWAIADAETGKLLWGLNDAAVRDPASVTKIMTAQLVCRLAAEDPAVLDEVITFSERADNTSGSTADVRAGELVTVGQLLYGLMLPSGNDASVAFAEHFGDRFPGGEDEAPYDRFIAAMNAEAKRLGMNETGYRNPHGLTAEGHVTSARDMVKLAHAAMQSATFREVVATRRLGVTLKSVAGYERNAIWNNTDRLLGYEGFYGVKTGTTRPAGACLVSAGERGGKRLCVVILGAISSDNRYLDARNLYRWAWKELGIE